MIGPDNRTDGEYYHDAKWYWIKKMLKDVKDRDLDRFKIHNKDRHDAKVLEKLAKKEGD